MHILGLYWGYIGVILGLYSVNFLADGPANCSSGGQARSFLVLSSFRRASPGIKFRRICLLSCCGGRELQESAFSLAWLAEA